MHVTDLHDYVHVGLGVVKAAVSVLEEASLNALANNERTTELEWSNFMMTQFIRLSITDIALSSCRYPIQVFETYKKRS